ncbi:MipA/OmpV family protein [Aestuariirhabdus sp. Z084]|uniref:MipA/OmpV family protein n=1 Tax=Aestuariirhabdus haliotis TaxID=2918751 RepID=UPI00201B393F|nr:MipA/OmpV family protein [Aestuariirhabdus haliotis]MCL6417558.1 MipA/OmpV family protein [Aestuariirhabdus haliotis]MCL6421487.1 MipA/OmpV family protein [Aestuariirhabdus haliotis]
MRVLVIGFALLSMLPLPLTAEDVTDLGWLEQPVGSWSLGATFRGQTSPYRGEEIQDDFLPHITYEGERFFMSGPRAGVHLLNDSPWEIDLALSYRFAGYNEENDKFLEGMERDDSVDFQAVFARQTDWGRFSLTPSADISNKHRGWDTSLQWSGHSRKGRWQWQPWIGATYQSQQLAQYYYGVESDEVITGRPVYDTGSAINASIGLNIDYQWTSDVHLSLGLEQERLDSNLVDSPIIDQRNLFKMALGIHHRFGGEESSAFQQALDEDDGLEGVWFWRAAAGLSTETKFNEIVRGKIDSDSSRTGIASLFVGKQVGNSLFGWPLDIFVKGGVAYHDERDLQGNFPEYILAIKGYYNRFPWSDRLETRWGIAEGISYAHKIPAVERDNVESKNRDASHLLNYIDWSVDVNLGDLFNSRSLKRCYGGWSIHHRSGIFGSADLFGNVDGGSNYNTLYIECLNTVTRR